MQDHPGKQVDDADISREERDDLGAAEDNEGPDVEEVGEHPQEAEQAGLAHEFSWKQKVV